MTKYLHHGQLRSSRSDPLIISLHSYSLRIFIAEKLKQAQINDKEIHIILNRGCAQ